jgi:hypothetical protein
VHYGYANGHASSALRPGSGTLAARFRAQMPEQFEARERIAEQLPLVQQRIYERCVAAQRGAQRASDLGNEQLRQTWARSACVAVEEAEQALRTRNWAAAVAAVGRAEAARSTAYGLARAEGVTWAAVADEACNARVTNVQLRLAETLREEGEARPAAYTPARASSARDVLEIDGARRRRRRR